MPPGWPLVPLLLCGWLLATTAAAQPTVAIPAWTGEGSVDAAQIEAAIQDVESLEGVAEEERTRTIERLRQALRQLETIRASQSAAAAFEQALQAPLDAVADRQVGSADERPQPSLGSMGVAADASTAELEQRLVREQADLAAAEARVTGLDRTLEQEQTRPTAIRARLAAIELARKETDAALRAPAREGEPPFRSAARMLSLQLQLHALASESEMLDKELLSNPRRLEQLRRERDLAARQLDLQRRRVELLQAEVNARRRAEAESARRQAAEAERQAARHPALVRVAERNSELTGRIADVAADLQRVSEARQQAEALGKRIQDSGQRTRQRLEIGGLSEALGGILLDERRRLPQAADYAGEMRERRERIAEIGLSLVRFEEELRELTPIDDAVDRELGAFLETGEPVGDVDELRDGLADLLRSRVELLNGATDTYGAYLRALGDLEFVQQQTLASTREYRDLLDEHLLWIPTSAAIGIGTVRDFVGALWWLVDPGNWFDALAAMVAEMRDSAGLALAAILVTTFLFRLRGPLRRRREHDNRKVGRLSTDAIALTAEGLVITVMRAAPWPALLAVPGYFLRGSLFGGDFGHAIGQALLVTAPLLFNLLFVYGFCSPQGVARVHYRWRADGLQVVRHELRKLVVIGVPVVFIASAASASTVVGHGDSLGRFAFMVGLLALAWFFRQVLHPGREVMREYLRQRPRQWISRTRYLWYALAVGSPLALAAISAYGYLYTAAELAARVANTIWLVLGIVIVRDLVIRWLVLEQRRIAWRRAIERREAARAARAQEEDQGGQAVPAPVEGEVAVAESEPVDLAAVDVQTRKLLNAVLFFSGAIGVFLIWSEVLPALAILNDVSVWTQSVTVAGEEQIQPITLADVLLGLVILIITLIAARNVPGVLEIAFLQRMEFEPGSRYAITTLIRYVIFSVGVIVLFSALGWQWSQLQWLVAALGVGLGFGLQEIVANFVSGLIILFERPVRVGDTVTVGDLSGTVSRIRIRATTIIDWDRKEIIVPNKNFITERVINWTLSDQVTRVVVNVGIAYGSDTAKAEEIVLETVRSLPRVMDDPAPGVYFVGFGEHALEFRIYVYARELVDRFPLIHEIHTRVNRALAEHGFTIPFPQRDLHIRSMADDVARGLGGHGRAGAGGQPGGAEV